MTPEQRHDKIKHRRAQITRLERKAKALHTRIKNARKSLAGLERVQAKLGVDAAAIEAKREEAAGLAFLDRYIGKCKKPKPELTTHFVLHADKVLYRANDPGKYGRAGEVLVRRTICGGYVHPNEGYALRKDVQVTCEKCAAIQQAWLAQSKRKPLTLRRADVLRTTMAVAAREATQGGPQ